MTSISKTGHVPLIRVYWFYWSWKLVPFSFFVVLQIRTKNDFSKKSQVAIFKFLWWQILGEWFLLQPAGMNPRSESRQFLLLPDGPQWWPRRPEIGRVGSPRLQRRLERRCWTCPGRSWCCFGHPAEYVLLQLNLKSN